MAKKELLFLSIDIEADGRAPGLSSMLNFGAAAILPHIKQVVRTWNYNLHPLDDAKPDPETMKWWASKPEAWARLQTDRKYPAEAMPEFASDVEELQKTYRVVPVAWPASFDFAWLNHYLWRFAGRNPLGHSCKCIGSYAWAVGRVKHPSDRNAAIEQSVEPGYEHTHLGVEDAIEQGLQFVNMWRKTTEAVD